MLAGECINALGMLGSAHSVQLFLFFYLAPSVLLFSSFDYEELTLL